MSNVINISVPVSIKGRRYPGVTVHPGVGMKFVDSCNPDSKCIEFSNCHPLVAHSVKPMCSAISNAEDVDAHDWCHEFLQVTPLVAPTE